jgi:hypothetical protein
MAAGTDEHTFIITNFALIASDTSESECILDSGATSHFDPTQENFKSFHEIPPRPIRAADGCTFHATGKGDITFIIRSGSKEHKITLRETLFAPTMPMPLISISRIAKSGYKLTFGKDGAQLVGPTGNEIFKVPEKNGLYIVPSNCDGKHEVANVTLTPTQLHRYLSHVYPTAANRLVKQNIVDGITLVPGDELSFCKPCVKAKHLWESFPKEWDGERKMTYGELIYSDVWGPAKLKTKHGMRWFITFTDDCRHETHVYLMATKDQALEKYKTYEAWVST